MIGLRKGLKMRLVLSLCFVVAMCGVSLSQELGPGVMPLAVPCPNCVQPPQTLYVPQVQMLPYQYQRTDIARRHYVTPIRAWFFGRYRINHVYSPAQASR